MTNNMLKIKIIIFTLLFFVLGSLFFLKAQETGGTLDQEQIPVEDTAQAKPDQEYLKGSIIKILEEGNQDVYGQIQYYQRLQIKISNGSVKNKEIEVYSSLESPDSPLKYKQGDKVTVLRLYMDDGQEQYYVTDYQRMNYLGILLVVFTLLVLAVGRLSGLLSLIGIVYSFCVVFYFMLPKLSLGGNPLISLLISTILIAPVIFFLSHGLNKKTTISLVSTLISIIITALMAVFLISISRLTGSASEESLFLQYTMGQSFNISGLLLGGIIIGSLGILADVTISQASIVEDLSKSKIKLTFKETFLKSLELGRSHILRSIISLVFLYISCSFPLLILFTKADIPSSVIINSEIISEEAVRILVSGIGLILSVPLTILLSIKFLTPVTTRRAVKKFTK
ncbi:hypothetical protein A2V49_03965 [candidate division WWE3 bacterium RBG_19FT_COMBO_34_6]|uniref:YibE/F family protein n=1 Tax=candidate division WWE3 bacterium RBG_19FT_COMBO_34_6 TaxID=1802612 RepID=A0A1F4ULV7_UNCKA|nr:MAG: hypothetical protein A2V49_03965 [candidate division WWE3 bacterium RBG_19FT_COMBO_34_6]